MLIFFEVDFVDVYYFGYFNGLKFGLIVREFFVFDVVL